MRLVIDNIKGEHYRWLTEMAKTLNFEVVEVNMSEDEEDAYLLSEMEAVKNEPTATPEEVSSFRTWLKDNK